jgi:hypothetical protein
MLVLHSIKRLKRPAPLDRAKSLVALYTLEEKINATTSASRGVERLGIPPYQWWNEGLHGKRLLLSKFKGACTEVARHCWTLHEFQQKWRVQLQYKFSSADLDGRGFRRCPHHQGCDGNLYRSESVQQRQPVCTYVTIRELH